MSKQFIYTIFFILVISIGAAIAIFFAKGYRFSSKTGTLAGTGIISITSVPDQASVFLDGHLTTATNTNINSLPPKDYIVRITKDGYISWEKMITVKEGLVTQIKAQLWPAIPTVYPLTFNGVINASLSPDGQRLLFIVPASADAETSIEGLKKSGIWVWDMANGGPLNFNAGREPHRVADLASGVDYTKVGLRWSPDSNQVLLTLPDKTLQLDVTKFNDVPQDITAILEPTVKQYEADQRSKDALKLSSIKDFNLRNEASSAALLKWSPDETKYLESANGKDNFKVVDLLSGNSYSIPTAKTISWLPDSRHLLVVEESSSSAGQSENKSPTPSPSSGISSSFPSAKISIIEFDGSNKSEIYVGNLDESNVYPWPDGSRMVIISSVPTSTGNIPNLFGINLK